MTVINARIVVAPDGAISADTPLPAGEHAAIITRRPNHTPPPQRARPATNLVATMLANGIDQILTFNDADLRRFGTLIALAAPQPASVANA